MPQTCIEHFALYLLNWVGFISYIIQGLWVSIDVDVGCMCIYKK